MNLAVFDIDGTLTRTSRVDDACFMAAFEESHGISGISTDWSAYRESTDQGILIELIESRLGRAVPDEDIEQMLACFVRRLGDAGEADPLLFTPIPGAIEFCAHLRESKDWRIALATGGWKASAKFKLQSSGFQLEDIPAAFSNDSPNRVQIIRLAHERARMTYGCEFDRVVLLGDAEWDIRAARELGCPFIGIGHEKGETYLREHGARTVLKDYRSIDQVMDALKNAVPPTPGAIPKPDPSKSLQ